MNKTIDEETKAALEKMISDGVVSRESAAKYFPELKESEGEKIKNQILYAIRQLPICKETKDKCVAWVEDKSVEWDKSDITTLGEIIMTLHTGVFMSSPDRTRQVEWLKRLTPRPKQELGEIDKSIICDTISYLNDYMSGRGCVEGSKYYVERCIVWLDNLKKI